MRYMIPMMKREIEIRNFERASKQRGGSLWNQLKHDARFIKHVKLHASTLQLDIHVAFYQAVEEYRGLSKTDDIMARNTAAKATTRLVENADHLLCSTPQEKHAMLHTLETVRGVKDADDALFDLLKKDSERVIEDTIMASFSSCGAYRRFVEDLFPVIANHVE